MARSKKRSSGESARAAYWRARIKEWESSGLTQSEFCRQGELSLPSLRWWRWSLRKRDHQDSQPKFLPVKVVSTEGSQLADSGGRSGDFEVLLRQGCRIRVPQDFDSESLSRLLRVLEESRC